MAIVLGGIVLNFILAKLVYACNIPLYLDTIGSIVVAGNCGLFMGILTALVSNILCAQFSELSLYYAIVNILVVMCSVWMFSKGVLKRKGGILLFALVLALVSGTLGSLIEWALNDVPEDSLFTKLAVMISEYTGAGEILSFTLSDIAFNFADKLISVAAALWISKRLPQKPEEELQEDVQGEEMSEESRTRTRQRLLLILGAEAILLVVVIAWISVSLYMNNARRERIRIAEGAAQIVAKSVDAEKVDEFIEKGYFAEGYKETENLLYSILEDTSYLEYVYVYRILEDGCQVVFDLETEGVEAGTPGEIFDFDESFLPYIPTLLAGEEIEPIESNDTYGWLLTAYKPIYNKDGNCVAYAGVDVSMLDLRAYVNEFLIRIVLISSAFLIFSLALGIWLTTNYQQIIDAQYEQIRAAKDEADRANSAKSRFLANMSHEIRTPINTIMGMDEMILREDVTGVPKGYAGAVMGFATDIKRASELLLGLVNDVLDLSKIESGKMNLVEQDYDPVELFRQVTTMIRVRSNEKKLDFDTEIDGQLPKRLHGDEQKIKQVILNLLTNAVKYTEKGGFVLRISVVKKEADRCRIYFGVKDTGMGVKEEDIDKLFSAFERLDEEKNSAIQGTGLGLDISKQFVNLMGGDLKCDSIYGEGSIFYFTVDQGIVDAEPIGEFTENDGKSKTGAYVPQFVAPEGKALIVDDNEMNLQVIRGLLKGTKLQLVTAMSGRECLEKLQSESFHVVLLDHMMPEMDGIETLEEIRKDFADLPVIALTANAANDGGDFYRQKGFQNYLAKPVDGEKLESAIKEYLPKELMTEPDAAEYAAEEEGLPEELSWLNDTEGISVSDGMRFCGGMEAFVKSLTTFYDTLAENADAIEDAYGRRDIAFYTIKVHALKSSARIIGAKELSELARTLEDAGKAEDLAYIEANTDELLRQYRSYAEKLAGLQQDDEAENEGKEPIPEGELEEAYEALKEVIPQMDYDAVEMVLEQLDGYRLPKEDAEFFARLRKLLTKFDWDGMETLIG